MKVYWRVDPKPVGPYASFQSRSWPMGWDDKKQSNALVQITCDERYSPYAAKTGQHPPLKILVAVPTENRKSFTWRKLKGDWARLEHAKKAAEKFVFQNRDNLKREGMK